MRHRNENQEIRLMNVLNTFSFVYGIVVELHISDMDLDFFNTNLYLC